MSPERFTKPPGDYTGDTGGQDKSAMDRGPLPGMGYCVWLIVNGVGAKHPRCPVVENYITKGQEKRKPILVQDNYSQHHEEMEMEFNVTAAEMHEFGRGRDQAQTGHGRAKLPAPILPTRSGGNEGQDRALNQAVRQASPDQQAKADHPNGMHPE